MNNYAGKLKLVEGMLVHFHFCPNFPGAQSPFPEMGLEPETNDGDFEVTQHQWYFGIVSVAY